MVINNRQSYLLCWGSTETRLLLIWKLLLRLQLQSCFPSSSSGHWSQISPLENEQLILMVRSLLPLFYTDTINSFVLVICLVQPWLRGDSGGGASLASKLRSLSSESFVQLLSAIFKIVRVMCIWLYLGTLYSLKFNFFFTETKLKCWMFQL